MKKRGEARSDAEKRTPISAVLATATSRALRAARVDEAARWAARVLFWGGLGVGFFAWRFEQGASTAGRNVVVVLLTAACVALASFAKKREPRRKGRRALALAAARRLEKRFSEQAGVFVAAVDFCEGNERGAFETSEATSCALRDATVEAATRRYEEIASKFDEAELNAVLTGLPIKRFRQRGKIRRFLALGVLANAAILGILRIGEEGRDGPKDGAPPAKSRNESTSIPFEKIEENAEVEKRGEAKKNASNREIEEEGEVGGDRENGEENVGTNDGNDLSEEQEISTAALETLIFELAQNAEIAEFLKTELEKALAVEERAAEKSETDVDATQLLQLAREFEANLTRPATGLVAQTRRLKNAARREGRRAEIRLTEMGVLGRKKEKAEIDVIKEVSKEGEIGKRVDGVPQSARRVSGREIAVFLLLSRLEKFGAETEARGVGDLTSLGLSRILRSDSAKERKKILAEATERVGEWGRILRREETATRILSESWAFDATSQTWAERITRVKEENRTALARFAGRLNVELGASQENDEELAEAKRRLRVCWNETLAVEKEGIAVVERLRERLQREETQDFIDFVAGEGRLTNFGDFLTVAADEAAFNALSDATSRLVERNATLTQCLENNRFGCAAEYWQDEGAAFWEGRSPLFVENLSTERQTNNVEEGLSVAVVEVGVVGDAALEEKSEADAPNAKRRFSALASLLTLGIEVKTSVGNNEQSLESEGGETSENAEKSEFALLKGQRKEEMRANVKVGDQEEKQNAASSEREEFDAMSQNGLPSENREKEKIKGTGDKVNVEKLDRWEGNLNDDWTKVDKANNDNANNDGGKESGTNAAGSVDGNAKVDESEKREPLKNEAFSGELPQEARRRFEGTEAPEILPEYSEKIRLYRRRILEEKR